MLITGIYFAFWLTVAVALVIGAFFLATSNSLLNGADILAAVMVMTSGMILARLRRASVAIALREQDDEHINRLN